MKVRSVHTAVQSTDVKRLTPTGLFTAAYVGYNMLGLVSAPWMINGAYDKSLCWRLFLTGLAGLLCGAWVARKVIRSRRPRGRVGDRRSRQLSGFFFVVFCGCVGFSVIASHGIPLLQGEDRFANSALASNLAPFYGFWVLVRMISDTEHGRRTSRIAPLVYMAGVLLLGYRTPVLAFVVTYTAYLIIFRFTRRRAIWTAVAVSCLLVAFAASLSLLRVTQDYDALSFFGNVNTAFVAEHPGVMPLIPALSMFDASQDTIATLGRVMNEPMYGRLALTNFETFLPGKHWGARNVIGDLTGARWIAGRPMSITPTLQGALFVDFAQAGVFIGFFLIAMVIRKLQVLAGSGGALARFCACYFFSMTLMSIHAGYWDVNCIFVGVFALILKIFDQLKTLNPMHVPLGRGL